jgi:hypothetical protein
MFKKEPFGGILGAFWIFLYGMSQRPFDPSQRLFDLSPTLKIRSSLHDDSVDMLTFLRRYFKTGNNWLLIKKDCQFKFLWLYLIFCYCFQLNFINGLKRAWKYVFFQILGKKFKKNLQSRCQYRDPRTHKIQYRSPSSEKMSRYCKL